MTAVPSGWSPEQARKRLEAATPGPWESSMAAVQMADGTVLAHSIVGADQNFAQADADAAFIAHAPTDIAALLALLDDAREGIRRLQRAVGETTTDEETYEVVTEFARAFLARFAAEKDNP